MSDRFQNKYRIPSARAAWHDYDGGIYYITICTADREHYFGKILVDNNKEPQMQLSEIGKYTDNCIQQMATLHNDITVPLYQIMPNHIHLIVIVEIPNDVTSLQGKRTAEQKNQTPYYDVSTGKNEKMQQIANYCGRLSHIISRFKSAVTKYARLNSIPFEWQTRFHDRIVRNQDELNRIAEYIENNVANWNIDKLNICNPE